jgi:hypothetical protein
VRALLAITEQKTLLEQNPLLARSIRNQYAGSQRSWRGG